jgi:hypothetical protein
VNLPATAPATSSALRFGDEAVPVIPSDSTTSHVLSAIAVSDQSLASRALRARSQTPQSPTQQENIMNHVRKSIAMTTSSL